MKQRIFLDETLILNKYNNGNSLTSLAREFNISRSTITKILGKYTIIKNKKLNSEVIKRCIDEFKINKNLKQISEKLKISLASVRRILRKNNIINYKVRCDRDTQNKIIEEYNKTKSIKLIEEKLGVCREVCARILNQNGIKTDNIVAKHLNEKEVIDVYNTSLSLKATSKQLGVSEYIIRRCLNKHDIKIKRNTHDCDDDFFSKDTPEAFYFAGFIAADGCLFQNAYSKMLCIGISSVDHKILEDFKKYIHFTGPIRKTAPRSSGIGKTLSNESSSIKIVSTKIFDDLMNRFNITPQKSLTYKFPRHLIGHPLINHFMRGLVDGDGSFCVSNNELLFSMCGTKHELEGFKDVLIKNCNISKKVNIRQSKSICNLGYHGHKDVLAIRDFLYKDSNESLRLERKYNKSHNINGLNFGTIEHRCHPVCAINVNSGQVLYFDSLREAERGGFYRCNIIKCCEGKYSQHAGFKWHYAINNEIQKYSKNEYLKKIGGCHE